METVNQSKPRKQNSDKVKRFRAKRRHEIQAYKERPCADCGIQYPYFVMQFDHVRGVKKANMANVFVDFISKERILAEIAKCDVVCSNCHSLRSWKRQFPGKPVPEVVRQDSLPA